MYDIVVFPSHIIVSCSTCIQWNTYVIDRVVGRYENLKLASINKRYLNGTSSASILPESGDAPTPLSTSDGPETCKGKYGGGHVVILLGAWKDCASLKVAKSQNFFQFGSNLPKKCTKN